LAGECPDDLHRPWIDKVTWECNECGNGTKRRIKDILDVWLDSGSVMWAAQEVYDGESHYDSWVPANFIIEGKDQIRGWFNSLLCSAMVSSERKNYESCYMHGWVLRDNQKMSKSKGNFFEPEDLINGTLKDLQKNKSYSKIKGIETFRFYSIGATQPGRDLNFNVKEYADTYRAINTIWNVYVYANQKFRLAEFDPTDHSYDLKDLNKSDLWILSKTNSIIKEVTQLSDDYKLPWITDTLRDFILNDISRWYIVLNREKIDVYSEDPNKYAIMSLLFEILYKVLLMLAPITPMLSEHLYQKLFKPYMSTFDLESLESIHLQNYPEYNEGLIDSKLEKQMEFTRELIEVARSIKNKNRIRLRWPNKKLVIETTEEMPEVELTEIIKQSINIRELEVVESFEPDNNFVKMESKFGDIYLDLSVDDDILSDRIVNDLIRNIQYSRKNNEFKVGEEISLTIGTNSSYIKGYVEENQEFISEKVSAPKLEVAEGTDIADEEAMEEMKICTNKECSASLKKNITKKLDNQKDTNCPYCQAELTSENVNTIVFSFKKNS
ncbi:MAG: class I tRNA ligase family protein, partial [Candidatus Lokiarchaeota archaeon]|nr:class I tRNA ligase family protein [Candidatus Lokiarchaeota archaeon]MBD3201333.1 class I tRNA ligase family protein [Candidatus Lokiarchaeota archaeon]